MSVSTYCSIGGHARCPRGGCSCTCHRELAPSDVRKVVTQLREEPTMEPESIPCPECGRRCGSGPGLASHMRSMHPDSAPPPSGGTLKPGELRWEEPPQTKPDLSVALRPVMLELKRRAGHWARILDYPRSKTTAGVTVTKLKALFPDIEFAARKIDGGERGSAVWARFSEEG